MGRAKVSGAKETGPPPSFLSEPLTDRKSPRGRPTVFTRTRKQEFCDRLIAGESVREICASNWMPWESDIYRKHLRNDASFREQYTQARADSLERWEDEIIEISDDSSNDYIDRMTKNGEIVTVVDTDHINRSRLRVDSRKWLMSKRLPKKYGDRVQTDVAGTLTLEALVSAAVAPPKLLDGPAVVEREE